MTTDKNKARPTSKKQVEANKRNAQKSTGPKSPEGKRRSSQNPTRHGMYARQAFAVPRGEFQEDEGEVDAFVDAIVDALDPRDALEHEAAGRVAVAYLRLRRGDGYEAELLPRQAALDPWTT